MQECSLIVHLKYEITCDFCHRIVHVSNYYQSSTNDITISREPGIREYAREDVQIIADKGYDGEQYVITLRKNLLGDD